MAAADYFLSGRLRAWLSTRFFNILPVARLHVTRANNPLETMPEALGVGESLILFPEGTRGGGGEPGRFLPGGAHLVEACPEVPIVPAFLLTLGRSLPKGTFLPVPFFAEVRLGPPLYPTGTREEILAQLDAAVRAARGHLSAGWPSRRACATVER